MKSNLFQHRGDLKLYEVVRGKKFRIRQNVNCEWEKGIECKSLETGKSFSFGLSYFLKHFAPYQLSVEDRLQRRIIELESVAALSIEVIEHCRLFTPDGPAKRNIEKFLHNKKIKELRKEIEEYQL